MDASTSWGASASPTGSFGFSRKARIRSGDDGSMSITPNWSASSIGCRMAATVHPAPLSTCASTIWQKSIR
jgi:hypothetical protein